MTDEELNRIADRLAEKIQNAVVRSVYEDAGKSLIGAFKNVLWACVIAVAAWGAARYGSGS